MAVKLRLARGGTKKRPYYRIVAAEASMPRDGRFLEKIGSYDPMVAKDHPNRVVIDQERAKHWLSHGAQPTDRVARFLAKLGLIAPRVYADQPKKSLPSAKTIERNEAKAQKLKDQAEAALAADAAVAEAPAEAAEAAPEAAEPQA